MIYYYISVYPPPNNDSICGVRIPRQERVDEPSIGHTRPGAFPDHRGLVRDRDRPLQHVRLRPGLQRMQILQ